MSLGACTFLQKSGRCLNDSYTRNETDHRSARWGRRNEMIIDLPHAHSDVRCVSLNTKTIKSTELVNYRSYCTRFNLCRMYAA